MTANTDKVEEKAAKELERMKARKSPAEMEKELNPHNVVCKIRARQMNEFKASSHDVQLCR